MVLPAAPLHNRLRTRGPGPRPPSAGGRRRYDLRQLVVLDEVAGREDEDLAHYVGMLRVAAHEADHLPAGRQLDDLLEACAHELLELHPLLDDGVTAAAREQRLLDA